MFWLNGGWREDGWRGPRPPSIAWENRGGPLRGFKPGVGFHGGMSPHPRNAPWFGGHGEPHGDFAGHGGPGSHGGFGGGPGHH